MKLITFAVPCYNSAEYMDKCINSLLLAGDKAEIIIVDDGSTKDNTAEIADDYAKRYPDIIKSVHKENGGHGDAVNTGIKHATGKYFKVVDSDDWADPDALEKLMALLESFEGQESPDCVVVNYVYEHVYNGTRKFINYRKEFPVNRLFEFEESKPFETGKYLAMHSLVYRTQLLRDIDLTLPKHTFYVDNVFIFKPLPYVKKFYYLDVDFYRYFIGRADQSVNEEVIQRRIDQHIKVTKILLGLHDVNSFKETRPKLYKYSESYLLIMMVINSIYLIREGSKESLEKKDDLWEKLREENPVLYKKFRRRFSGAFTSSKNGFVLALSRFIYKIVRKIFKFN